MVDLAGDSLSNLSLVLRKTSPRLNAPGLLARCCGLGEGFDGRGGVVGEGVRRGEVLVGMVEAFGPGEEERVLPRVCHLFEVRVPSDVIYSMSGISFCHACMSSYDNAFHV